MPLKTNIRIKTDEEIKILQKAGRILANIVEEVRRSLKSGMTTSEIDRFAESLIHKANVKPAFKGYRGFPACACISVNDAVVHGIPGKYRVKEGDIVSVDIGIIYKDYYSDTATTIPVGHVGSEIQRLLDVTKQALHKGIEQAQVGHHLSDISHAIQTYVDSYDYGIVRDFVGHGIGRELHEDPEIPNFGPPNQGPVLEEGMVFAIEPMVNLGSHETKIADDGWTVVTKDGSLSAHFEHSIVVGKSGGKILTEIE